MPDSSLDIPGQLGRWQALVKVSFQYNRGILHGNPNIIVTSGAPASITAPVGTLAWDVTGSDGYICTVADTTWVKLNA
jgi:hypothetical protein